ncbi:MAG: hypothetical protein Pg6C_15520 [Treponemataceae bacterium]|nr:MAG: hypothetical protein Pg6C_15520 [Treponemataceae bacterium]
MLDGFEMSLYFIRYKRMMRQAAAATIERRQVNFTIQKNHLVLIPLFFLKNKNLEVMSCY